MEDTGSRSDRTQEDQQQQRGHFFGFGDPTHKQSILQEITEQRYKDVAAAKQSLSEKDLTALITAFDAEFGPPLDLFARIKQEDDIAVAAEFKRASPSKGDIATHLVAAEQGVKYAQVGAAVLSVLTEPKWFKGSLTDMKEVRTATQALVEGSHTSRPAILRKDFVVDKHMILEARAHGADTVLLIVAILEVQQLVDLIDFCRKMDMEPLVEVHTDEEMEIALAAGSKVIGVNNRNLHTFQLDLDTTARVAGIAKSKGITWGQREGQIQLAALSGITGPQDVERFRTLGASMVLVGETLMRAADPGQAIRRLLGQDGEEEARHSLHLVKVCGVTSVEDALVAAGAGANLIGIIFAEKSKRRVDDSTAKAIVKAVREFGERSEKKRMEAPQLATAGTTFEIAKKWFQDWSKTITEASRRAPLVVGVFQNQALDEVHAVASSVGLDVVQLHGDEGLEACAQVGLPAIRVVHMAAGKGGSESSSEDRAKTVVSPLKGGFAAAVLLDTSVKGVQGGTGVTFDLAVAEGIPVMVAGGLTAESIADVVCKTKAWGFDVSSGVEESPGCKDHAKVEAFVSNARQAFTDSSKSS